MADGKRSRKTGGRAVQRGVTLIMVAAVLAVLAAMATGFFVIALSQTNSAVRYADSVRAEMLAQAGVHYAIAELREQAFKRTEEPNDPWYPVDYLHGARKQVSYADSLRLHDGVDDGGDGVAGKRHKNYAATKGLHAACIVVAPVQYSAHVCSTWCNVKYFPEKTCINWGGGGGRIESAVRIRGVSSHYPGFRGW